MMRNPRQNIPAHLEFLRQLDCCVCGNNIETQAAHLRFSDASVAKDNPGVGQKAHDFWCLPLCGTCHDEQHRAGDEKQWWASHDIDPIKLAMALYVYSGNHEKASLVIQRQHELV